MNRFTLVAAGILLSLAACQSADNNKNQLTRQQAQTYLDSYNKTYQDLIYKDNLAQWTLNTRIVKGDTLSQQLADAADKVIAEYTGSKANIDSAQKYLQLKDQLTPLQVRQFEVILFNAGNNPAPAVSALPTGNCPLFTDSSSPSMANLSPQVVSMKSLNLPIISRKEEKHGPPVRK